MEEKQQHEVDKIDDVILPGFRFHPTDEELVGFYLKRRIQQAALPIELIKQVDIYKYDPWDLPKLAATGEKEWYFYCPRDRKYRNSARPNRVTGAGFWKATGTDRPIYSSDGTKCVGLKKSLVFYRGRAAKGIKTDWMMHEFRLPSITDTVHQKKLFDRTIPINDSWVICRIFKKTNSMAQRALSYSWVGTNYNSTHHHLTNQDHNMSTSCCTTEVGSSHIPLPTHDYFQPHNLNPGPFSPSLDQLPFYKLINHPNPTPTTTARTSFYFPTISSNRDFMNNNNNNNFMFPTHHGHDISSVLQVPKSSSSSVDVSSLLLNLAAPTVTTTGEVGKMTTTQNTDFTGSQPQQQLNGHPISSLLDLPGNLVSEEQQLCSEHEKRQQQNTDQTHDQTNNHSSGFKSMGFPLSFPSNLGDPWKPAISWEETPSCPSDMSTSYSSNKCYT